MIEGEILERQDDPHVWRRNELLHDCGQVLPEIGPPIFGRAKDLGPSAVPDLLAELAARGFAMRQLDRPLTTAEFLALGAALGTPMPETDQAVQPFVEEGVILNLITRLGDTADVSLQPFATNYLSLHTEGSGRPVREQPRYLVLMCCEPGGETDAARTVLTPMTDVLRRLSAYHVEALGATCYRRANGDPWIVRRQEGRTVFSFRDFMNQPLEWTHRGRVPTPDLVNEALRALLDAMYQPDGLAAVRWRTGRLVVFDNTFYFHGRTARLLAPTKLRHLKRLRICVPATPAG